MISGIRSEGVIRYNPPLYNRSSPVFHPCTGHTIEKLSVEPGPVAGAYHCDMSEYLVNAAWDAEASVWVASSDDVPGLVTEAETLEKLEAKLQIMVPELLEANMASRILSHRLRDKLKLRAEVLLRVEVAR